ncbi:MAG: YggS family pyridoxal phosphate-dependent enzyme [Chloroflexi bacterium]|nr:YggS family pyridoxal phosphate-dependent enzyme [Chloroflexota bacterium]
MNIASNLAWVRQRIDTACRRAGRSIEDVTLVGVSKGVSAQAVAEACAAGLTDVGENRVQEAAAKIEAVAEYLRRPGRRGIEGSHQPTWHLIGHLQTNKAKTATNLFDILHSVDSLRLAQALSRRANELLPVLLEVNVAQDAAKFGFAPEEVTSALAAIAALPNLDVRGLMTIAPLTDDPETSRPFFRRLRELRDTLGLAELSMGMTGDFEVAIEEGATMIRVGRAIFGPRREVARREAEGT